MSAPVITTKRLILNRMTMDDLAVLHRYRSDPLVRRFQTGVAASPEETARFIREHESVSFDTPSSWFLLAVRLADAGRLIGDVGVRFPEKDTRQVELGFTIAPENQRRGYGTEAVTGVLAWLFETHGKHRVFASVDPRNDASLALLDRVGMRREAHHLQSYWTGSEWADDVVFGLLGSEWTGESGTRGKIEPGGEDQQKNA